MRSINIALSFLQLGADPDQREDWRCPSCDHRLKLHQPDIESPDRFLGVCMECRAWFLVDSTQAVLLRLPDRDALNDAQERPAAGRRDV